MSDSHRQKASEESRTRPSFIRWICSRMLCSSLTLSSDVKLNTSANPSPSFMYMECSAMNYSAEKQGESAAAATRSRPTPLRAHLLRPRRIQDLARAGEAIDLGRLPVRVLDCRICTSRPQLVSSAVVRPARAP